MSSGFLAVTVYFGTMDQDVDNLQRNLIEHLSGYEFVDPWALEQRDIIHGFPL